MKRVNDIVFKDLSSVNEKSTLRRAIKTMRLNRVCAIPVVNYLGEYVGIISEQDILNASIPDYMKAIAHTSFMADFDRISANLQGLLEEKVIKYTDASYPSVKLNDSLSLAADLLYRSGRDILPVVEGKIFIGLLNRLDILASSLTASNT